MRFSCRKSPAHKFLIRFRPVSHSDKSTSPVALLLPPDDNFLFITHSPTSDLSSYAVKSSDRFSCTLICLNPPWLIRGILPYHSVNHSQRQTWSDVTIDDKKYSKNIFDYGVILPFKRTLVEYIEKMDRCVVQKFSKDGIFWHLVPEIFPLESMIVFLSTENLVNAHSSAMRVDSSM